MEISQVKRLYGHMNVFVFLCLNYTVQIIQILQHTYSDILHTFRRIICGPYLNVNAK